jgi:DNA-binding NtrC family response regulator
MINAHSDRNIKELIQQQYLIIGKSQLITDAVDVLLQVAPTDLSVLITGETGTGKEIFAKAVHGLSKRKKKPFLSVNCGAIPENLLESELFGHEKGAFTGAVDQRTGFFEAANGGTLFLDEIGDLPLLTQVKLLRVLESGEFLRLGSSNIQRCDVRIIAATNYNLDQQVVDGKFRQDLFFRLNSVHIYLPALREHTEDLTLLVEYFGNLVCTKLGIRFEGIEDEALNIMKSLPWNGNVRELKNIINTIITLEKSPFITSESLRKYMPNALPPSSGQSFNVSASNPTSALVTTKKTFNMNHEVEMLYKTLFDIRNELSDVRLAMSKLWEQMLSIKSDTANLNFIQHQELSSIDTLIENENLTIAELERKMIVAALKKYSGNRRKAAESLGISQRTIYRKIEDHNISDDE